MRAPNVLDAKIRTHLELENVYTTEALQSTEGLQETQFGELRGRIREDNSLVPAKDGAWDYYVRYEQGAQHPPATAAEPPDQLNRTSPVKRTTSPAKKLSLMLMPKANSTPTST